MSGVNVMEVEADPEIEAMARIWIEQHWGLRWPEDVADDARPEVRRLMEALRTALDDARLRSRAAA
jgi:hypothetical protein